MGDPVRPDDQATEWSARRVQLDQRIRELHTRNEQLTRQRIAEGGEAASHLGGDDALRKAEERARQSQKRALEALRRAAVMRLRSAAAHVHAAETYERLADASGEGSPVHLGRAAAHRSAAATDRSVAAELMRAYEAEVNHIGG